MDHKKKAVGILAIGLAFIVTAVGTYVCGYFIGREAGKNEKVQNTVVNTTNTIVENTVENTVINEVNTVVDNAAVTTNETVEANEIANTVNTLEEAANTAGNLVTEAINTVSSGVQSLLNMVQ